MTDCCEYCGQEDRYGHNAVCVMNDVIDLRTANEQLRAALIHVRKIIVEAAETGFNCHDGDWAERLFASQAVTHPAVRKAEGRS